MYISRHSIVMKCLFVFSFQTLIMYSLASHYIYSKSNSSVWYPNTSTIWLQPSFPTLSFTKHTHPLAPMQTILHPHHISSHYFWSHSAFSYVYTLLHIYQKCFPPPVCLTKYCNPSPVQIPFFTRRHPQFYQLTFLSLSPTLSCYFVYASFPTLSWRTGISFYSGISTVLGNTWHSGKKKC